MPESGIDDEHWEAVTDRTGAKVPVLFWRTDTSFNWQLTMHGQKVGHAYCHQQGEVFFLADLYIEPVIDQPRPLWRRLLFRHPKQMNLRRRGLGTALLCRVIECARDLGCRSITGKIAERDLAAYPELPDWYRSHGFVATPTPASGVFAWKLRFHLQKDPDANVRT